MKPLDVLGVRVEMPTSQPIVLLRERDGGRHVPIWIGAASPAVGASNITEVLALATASSLDASQAPSVRAKATRLAPLSSTAKTASVMRGAVGSVTSITWRPASVVAKR